MPYRLKKAPKRDLYWVVGQDGKKHSKEPIPKERAQAQMRALYAAENQQMKGGITYEQFQELKGTLPRDARGEVTVTKEEWNDFRSKLISKLDDDQKHIASLISSTNAFRNEDALITIEKAFGWKPLGDDEFKYAYKPSRIRKGRGKRGGQLTDEQLEEYAPTIEKGLQTFVPGSEPTKGDYARYKRGVEKSQARGMKTRLMSYDEWAGLQRRREDERQAGVQESNKAFAQSLPGLVEGWEGLKADPLVMCPYDLKGNLQKTSMRQSECKTARDEWEKINHPENYYFFRPVTEGLVKVADFAAENIAPLLPGVGKLAGEVYKGVRGAVGPLEQDVMGSGRGKMHYVRTRGGVAPPRLTRNPGESQKDFNARRKSAYAEYRKQFEEEEVNRRMEMEKTPEMKAWRAQLAEESRLKSEAIQEKQLQEQLAKDPFAKAMYGISEAGNFLGDALSFVPGPIGTAARVFTTARDVGVFGNGKARRVGGRRVGGRRMRGDGFFGDLWASTKRLAQGAIERTKAVFRGVRQDFSPSVRNTLAQVGNLPVVEMVIRRDPIQSLLNKALNVISLGRWDKLRSEYNYDDLFHLGVEVTVRLSPSNEYVRRYVIEKNEVINVAPAKAYTDKTQTWRVPLSQTTTIDTLLANTKLLMGANFFVYDPFKNNCQDFIWSLLVANGLASPELKSVVKQPIEDLVSKLPGFTGKIAKAVTDVGAIANVALEGQGYTEFGKIIMKRNALKTGMERMMDDYARLYLEGKIEEAEEIGKRIKGMKKDLKKTDEMMLYSGLPTMGPGAAEDWSLPPGAPRGKGGKKKTSKSQYRPMTARKH